MPSPRKFRCRICGITDHSKGGVCKRCIDAADSIPAVSGDLPTPCSNCIVQDKTCDDCLNGRPADQPNFSGPEYDPANDFNRLTRQHERIRDLMLDGNWRSVFSIHKQTGDPENSIQAQLRHLRKPRFGAYIVEKKKESDGMFLYRLRVRTEDDPPYNGGTSTKNLKARCKILVGMVEEACVALEQSGDLFARVTCTELRTRLEEMGE